MSHPSDAIYRLRACTATLKCYTTPRIGEGGGGLVTDELSPVFPTPDIAKR